MESKGFSAPWEWLMDRPPSQDTERGVSRKQSRMRVFPGEMTGPHGEELGAGGWAGVVSEVG